MSRSSSSLALLFALAGCAARHPQCYAPATIQGYAPTSTYQVQSADGLCLQGYAWAPEAPARGAVVVVHGLRDHATRYGDLAQALNAQGLLVVAQDHRGHGLSGGKRQRFDAIPDLEQDIDLAVQRARTEAPGQPLFLFGHSMGGLVVTSYATSHPDGLAGVVLSGPALLLPDDIKPSEVRAAKLFGKLTPGLRAQALDDTQFVRDPAAKADLAADPLVDHFNLPAASARAAVVAIEGLKMESFSVPLLDMHGKADVATNPKGSEALVSRASSSDKTLRLYDSMFHDLLHEPEREAVTKDVVDWMTARCLLGLRSGQAGPDF